MDNLRTPEKKTEYQEYRHKRAARQRELWQTEKEAQMTNRITGGVELLDNNYCQKTEESSLIQANMGDSVS